MPPTIQKPRRPDDQERKRGERRSELVCRVKYNNTLPDIPFDPKFITYPFESNRYVQYNQTSLERSYKHDLLQEHDLGVVIDLINPDTYKLTPGVPLDVEDERLLEEDVTSLGESKRSRHHNKNVSWLRKTEYISTEYNRFMPSTEKPESRIGFSIKKYLKEEEVYKDRESQIAAIEQTFEEAQTEIVEHYSKPGVTAVEILPVFPDFELWKHPCAQVIFDSDPAPKGMTAPAQIEEMSQAMIRGVVDESGEQFVAYFLPTDETRTKRKRDQDDTVDYYSDEEYDYMLAREYNWNVKNKASRGYEETYFFTFRPDGVYYDELETRVRLSKRRKAAGATATSNTRLVVKHRPLNKNEIRSQDMRAAFLGPPGEEEEEEEGEEVVEGEVDMEGVQAESEKSGDEASGDDRSRRKSRPRSRSGSRSRSRSGSRSRSRSKSGSRSRSSSRSRSRSKSRSRSRSGSPASNRSRSKSRSRSGSPASSGSGSGSRSRSRSRSGSPASGHSRSRSPSPTGSNLKNDAEEIFGSGSDSD